MTESKPCECPLAGYCERHKITKNATLHKLCQTSDAYRKAWDAKQGPLQIVRDEKQANTRKKSARNGQARTKTPHVCRPPGVGSKIKEILKAADIKVKGCACNAKAMEWDRNGVEWCDEHRNELAGWLEAQAVAYEFSLVSAGVNLAVCYPLLAARIAASVALHPTRLNQMAAREIVAYAIEHVSDQSACCTRRQDASAPSVAATSQVSH